MSRKARELSIINSYSIFLKANTNLSFDQNDMELFLETIKKYSDILNFKLLAYALDKNILSFVLYDCDTQIETIMRKICISFVNKFNFFHIRHGKVFKERFLSIPANNIKQVWDMVSDIHSINSILSSKFDYFNDKYINVECAKQYYETKENFYNNVINRNTGNCPLILKPSLTLTKINDTQLIEFIMNNYNIAPNDLQNLPQKKLKEILTQVISKTKASARQLSRITNLPLRMLWNLNKVNVEVNQNDK